MTIAHVGRNGILAAAHVVGLMAALCCGLSFGQTTAGAGTTIVVPVTAQTASFTSETTVFNPNGVPVNVAVGFYEANNSPTPGPKTCNGLVVPANRSAQFVLATQCTLSGGSHFGLLVLTEQSGTSPIYGYVRTQNPQGIGFSTEGFPAGNFNDQVSHSTGLKKTTSGLIFQTNCFVGSLAQPVGYTLKLFNDTTGAQIGGTLAGNLNAFEQFRYLDIFGANGVNAPNVDHLNVRAEFTPTTSGNLVGFCTVQDNASFGADFRIAKSYGAPGTVTSLAQGAGITLSANPITTTGTIAADTGYLQRRVSSTCAAGSSIRAIAGDGTVTCQSDNVGGSGTVTSITAGIGLTGGTITTTGSIAADATYLQRRVSSTCAAGSSIRAIAADGTVTCQTDNAGPANAFVQSGNAFGAEAVLGTTDNFALDIRINGTRIMRYLPNTVSSSVIGGSPANNVTAGVRGATIAGGGIPVGDSDPNFQNEGPNRVTDAFGTVGGGYDNQAGDDAGTNIDAAFATVGGGQSNTASRTFSTVAGGASNQASGSRSTVAGGVGNVASGLYSSIRGGNNNAASSNYSTVGGGLNNSAAGQGTVGGGKDNTASDTSSTVGGGVGNTASGLWSAVGGGNQNAASAQGSTVSGGNSNAATATNTAVGGGNNNQATGQEGVIGGGFFNNATGLRSFVGGGSNNTASGDYSAIAGGELNSATGINSIAGGRSSSARGDYSIALGRRAKTIVSNNFGVGTIVLADSNDFDFADANNNRFSVRSTGGVRLVTAIDGTGGITAGVSLASGDSSWNVLSDRAAKENWRVVDSHDVLERLVAIPIARWNYKAQSAEVEHIGPSAQDFRAAFGLGHGDTTIATVDADGVALAAIQGLNAKVAAQAREIAELRSQATAEIAELKRLVEVLLARSSPEGRLAAR